MIKDPEFLHAIRSLPCLACGASYRIEAHHIKTRGSGGDDSAHNIIPLCSNCHTQDGTSWHRSWVRFLEKYPHVYAHLQQLGWEVFNGRLIEPRK